MKRVLEKKNLIFGNKLYLYSLIGLVIGLPLSQALTSIALGFLGGNWILEGGFKQKWHIIKSNHILWFFFILPFFYILWMANTEDVASGLSNLNSKIPLFALPLIISTSEILSKKQFILTLWFFTGAIFVGSLISMGVYLGLGNVPFNDIREISIFISHLRFALMIIFAICFLLWNYWDNKVHMPTPTKIMSVTLVFWFIFFLGILRVMTGWLILIIVFYALLFLYRRKIESRILKQSLLALSILIPIFLFLIIRVIYNDYSIVKPNQFTDLPTHTIHGNKYWHDTTKTTTERGYYYNILINWSELEEGWKQVSEVPFKSIDKEGFSTKHKIVRYLTSLGLPKDLEGIRQLDEKDIKLIEDGYASSIYKVRFKPYIRIYESIYDIDQYIKTGNPNGKSISMRTKFFKVGLYLLKNNFWLGVGTGDLESSFSLAYESIESKLEPEYQRTTHNQYLTFAITFGFVGFIFCLFSLFAPFFMVKQKSVLLICFVIIVFVSMLGQDMIDKQAGVNFYALLYSLLVFNYKTI